MMNLERKLGKIVEPFDQKDGLDLGGRPAKASGVRTRLTSPAMGQKGCIEKGAKKHIENSFNLQSEKRS
jgi:hypothetical protein